MSDFPTISSTNTATFADDIRVLITSYHVFTDKQILTTNSVKYLGIIVLLGNFI